VEFDDDRVDVSGVSDLRGSGRGGGLGRGAAIGGGGIVGIIVVALFVLLGGGLPEGGIDVGQITAGALGDGSSGETVSDLQTRCAQEGAVDTYLDCRMVKVYNVVNTTWDAEFARRGQSYQQPGLAFFSGGVRTGCGAATSQVGPFYCPPDQTMYFDLDFLQQLQRQYGAPGQFAQAYILAHEAGHHLQTLLGIEAQMRQEQQRRPNQVNELSVSLELQADCFAGVWAKLADQLPGEGIVLTPADIDQAMTAAAAVGDDRIQKAAGQRVNPERWTHGSSAQRRDWFNAGYESGDLNACDTFNA
jgi:predicted metalloprotease